MSEKHASFSKNFSKKFYLYIMPRGIINDLTGRRFENLLVLEKVPSVTRNGRTKAAFRCLCDCGNEKIILAQYFYGSAPQRSCGCRERERTAMDSIERLYNYAKGRPNNIRKGFELSLEQFKQLSLSICHYCGVPPSNTFNQGLKTERLLSYNGIDRFDTTKGYVPDNCVPCCFVCNSMKNSLTYRQFIDHISLLHARLC